MGREVAAKKTRVHGDTFYPSRRTQPNDAPIKFFLEPRASPPHRLPPVHPFTAFGILSFFPDRSRRLEQVFFRSKEFVIGEEHGSAEFFRGKIDEISEFHCYSTGVGVVAGSRY